MGLQYRLLDYLLKNMEVGAYKTFCDMIDIKGCKDFYPDICSILKNPETTDRNLLILVPGYLFHGKESLDNLIDKYREKFREMNEFLVKNGAMPIFENPDDVTACVNEREKLVDLLPEEYTNKYFNVKSFGEYTPKPYKKES